MTEFFQWSTGALTLLLTGIVGGLFIRAGRNETRLGEFIAQIETALLGIRSTGGMIKKVDDLMELKAKLPDLFMAERHAMRNEWQKHFTELQIEIKEELAKLTEKIERSQERRL